MPNLEEINKKTEELNKGEHGEIKIPDIIKSYYNKVNAVAKDFFDKYPQYPTTDVLKASDYFEIDRQMDVFAELYTEGMGMWSGERYASEICGVDKYIAKYDVIRAQYMTGFRILEDFSGIKEFQKQWNAYCDDEGKFNDVIKEDDEVGDMTIIAYKEYYENVLLPQKAKELGRDDAKR